MAESIRVWLKKIFSLTLILNALITIVAMTGILYGFYHAWPHWKPYTPYLINGNLFLIAGIAALINIFPSASIGRALHTGRLFFHHYVYGFFVLIFASIYTITSTPATMITLFLQNTSDVPINTGRCFLLIGFTLVLDDLPDVHTRIERTLNRIKSGFCKIRPAMHYLQLATGIITVYIFLAILLSAIAKPSFTISNDLTMTTLVFTSITSFACVRKKSWLKITPPSINLESSH
jgi:hypothetical protein